MTQQDDKLRKIQKAIAELEEAKKRRMAELSDPKRAKVRKLWEELRRAINELEDAGENLATSDGNALYITGDTFALGCNGELTSTKKGEDATKFFPSALR